ncbi:MAG TPA: Mur ligase domain-containing protein, partial [Thermoanaerobaculia bacterium]|nr:Mur ligase domain-containing protein [Thermoanaerobaculia bacterium]
MRIALSRWEREDVAAAREPVSRILPAARCPLRGRLLATRGSLLALPEVRMPRLTMSELARMAGGHVIQGGETVVESVVIDSREVKPDSVFFAIKGERLDGHQFVPQALET